MAWINEPLNAVRETVPKIDPSWVRQNGLQGTQPSGVHGRTLSGIAQITAS